MDVSQFFLVLAIVVLFVVVTAFLTNLVAMRRRDENGGLTHGQGGSYDPLR